jgi:ribosomal protein L31
MKTYTINIHPELREVTFTVKNGKKFEAALMRGSFDHFEIKVDPKDIDRVKKFAVKFGDDKSSCRGSWYAHCNGYAMDLCVTSAGQYVYINTYRPYGATRRG